MSKLLIGASVVLLLLGCGKSGPGGDDDDDNGTPTPTPTSTPENWVGLAELPLPRQEHPVAVVDGEIWVFGGFHSTFDITGSVSAYDPDTDQWRTDIAPIGAGAEIQMHHANVAVANGTVYVVGFLTGNFVADGRVLEYDATGNQWIEKTAMPAGTERGASYVAAIGDLIYVAGGLRGGAVADFSVYDTVNDTWTPLPDLPAPLDHGYGAVVGDVFYALGGRNGSITARNDVTYIYDPAGAGDWETGASMPTARGGVAGAVLSGKVYLLGGEGNPDDPDGVFADIEAYDPAADQWEVLDPMPDPRHGMGAAGLGGRIYVPGGGENQAFGPVARFDALIVE